MVVALLATFEGGVEEEDAGASGVMIAGMEDATGKIIETDHTLETSEAGNANEYMTGIGIATATENGRRVTNATGPISLGPGDHPRPRCGRDLLCRAVIFEIQEIRLLVLMLTAVGEAQEMDPSQPDPPTLILCFLNHPSVAGSVEVAEAEVVVVEIGIREPVETGAISTMIVTGTRAVGRRKAAGDGKPMNGIVGIADTRSLAETPGTTGRFGKGKTETANSSAPKRIVPHTNRRLPRTSRPRLLLPRHPHLVPFRVAKPRRRRKYNL